ncbi:MAG: type III pantothenate kinase [Spirochaetales bacterium]|nr:type III pantothenate kinase [Spirochaetales bacterium]
MILTIDIGNTNIAFGIWADGKWLDHWRLKTDVEKTSDEYFVLFRSLLAVSSHDFNGWDRIVVSSVVPTLTPAIVKVATQLSGKAPLIVRHDIETGLNAETPIPPELGSDLLANAVAAWHRYRRSCIVVDFGTALTFTAVSGDGRVLGVSIAPGLRSAVAALSTNTAQLPGVDLIPPPRALARTTVHSIQSGVVFGYVGLVKEVVGRMGAEMERTPLVVATGGLAETFAPVADYFDVVDQWLTLDGLRRLAELNPLSREKR